MTKYQPNTAEQAKIGLYKTRDPAKVAKMMGYASLEEFSDFYVLNYGITPEQALELVRPNGGAKAGARPRVPHLSGIEARMSRKPSQVNHKSTTSSFTSNR